MIRALVISHQFNTKIVKCSKERKKENPFALRSITLSAKLNAVSVSRVGMYTGDVLFSLQIWRAEDLPQEYGGITQVSVYYPPRPSRAKHRWT